MGSEGGGRDLNLGTPDPVRSAIRSASPPWPTCRAVVLVLGSSSVPEAKRSEKEVVMNGCVEKVKVGCEFAEVSKLPEEEAIKRRRERERIEFSERESFFVC